MSISLGGAVDRDNGTSSFEELKRHFSREYWGNYYGYNHIADKFMDVLGDILAVGLVASLLVSGTNHFSRKEKYLDSKLSLPPPVERVLSVQESTQLVSMNPLGIFYQNQQ